MKTVRGIHSNPHMHWVGDGFPVRSLFDYQGLGQQLSPFLLLDYAGPAEFTLQQNLAVWGNIHIEDSRPSALSMRVKSHIAIQPGKAASLDQAMCNG